GGAFTKDCARAFPIEGSQRVIAQQAKPVIMQDGLWFERGVVANRSGAIRFARSDGACRLSNGQSATDALVRDATVRTLETVTDTDVAHDIVREIFEQPHRVHCVDEFASECL